MHILLVEDHPLVRSAVELLLRQWQPDVELRAAATLNEAQRLLVEMAPPQCVIVDVSLPDGSGLDLIGACCRSWPGVPVVVLSAAVEPHLVLRALQAGARGYIPKAASPELMLQILNTVMAGALALPPNVIEVLRHTGTVGAAVAADVDTGLPDEAGGGPHLHEPYQARGSSPADLPGWLAPRLPAAWLHRAEEAQNPNPAPLTASQLARMFQLTPRQSEVLELMLRGEPNKIIARTLGLSVETVKDHVAAVLRVLHVQSRTQAVLTVGRWLHHSAEAFSPMSRVVVPTRAAHRHHPASSL